MKKTETLKRYEIVELGHYRNEELKKAVEKTFDKEEERITAWKTVHLIRKLYPEFEETLRGKLIHKQKQEIKT